MQIFSSKMPNDSLRAPDAVLPAGPGISMAEHVQAIGKMIHDCPGAPDAVTLDAYRGRVCRWGMLFN